MAIFVKFWGTRGSIPTPGYRSHRYGGNTSCVEIRVDGTLFICDGGTGLRELGQNLIRNGVKPLTAHLLFSHAHWDHIQGFPFFAPAYDPANTLYVYGPAPGDEQIYQLLSGQMGSHYFPVDFKDLAARILPRDLDDGSTDIEGVIVRAIATEHNGSSYAYSIEKDGRKVVYSTDHELDLVIQNPEETADPDVLRLLLPDFVEFCRGADLLISDAQYTDEEYPERIRWGHPRATTAVDLAIQCGVKQLALFHHDPMQTDRDVDAKVATCRKRARKFGAMDLLIFGAREGVELKFG